MNVFSLKALMCLSVFCFLTSPSILQGQAQVGDECGSVNTLYDQTANQSFNISPNNFMFLAYGQSFVAEADYDDVEGLYLNIRSISAGEYTLNLYSGAATGQPGMPIATGTIILTENVPTTEEVLLLFEFESSVSLTADNDYYFLMDPVYDAMSSSSLVNFRLTSDDFPGTRLSLLESSGVETIEGDEDLSFGLYTCSPSSSCSITNTLVLTDGTCDGGDATFTLSFDVSSGSGNYDLVVAADNADLGLTVGDVLGSIRSSLLGGTAVPITGTIPSTAVESQIMVQVVDVDNNECSLAEPVSVLIPACVIPDDLPALPRGLLLGLALVILGVGVVMLKRF